MGKCKKWLIIVGLFFIVFNSYAQTDLDNARKARRAELGLDTSKIKETKTLTAEELQIKSAQQGIAAGGVAFAGGTLLIINNIVYDVRENSLKNEKLNIGDQIKQKMYVKNSLIEQFNNRQIDHNTYEYKVKIVENEINNLENKLSEIESQYSIDIHAKAKKIINYSVAATFGVTACILFISSFVNKKKAAEAIYFDKNKRVELSIGTTITNGEVGVIYNIPIK